MNKTIRLNIYDNIIEDIGIKVSDKSIEMTNNHWHEYYELEIITSGTGYAEINGNKYKIREGSVILITPSDIHKYTNISGKLTLITLAFVPKTLEYNSFADSILLNDSIVAHADSETTKNIIFFLRKIQSESISENHLNKKYISYLLNCLMIELNRMKNLSVSETENSDRSVRKALSYIREHFKEQITLDDVAEEINLSPVYTSKKLNKVLGYGFNSLITELRLDYAERLLMYTDENITDISYYCGFNSTSYFSRAFRKKHNISPGKFRKNTDHNFSL